MIKPTHVALPLAHRIIDHFPTTKAVILTSSLEAFMLSNLKKGADSQNKIPELIRRMTAGTDFEAILTNTVFKQLTLLQQVALQWMTQQAVLATLLRRAGGERLKIVTEAELLANMESTTLSVARWLQLPLDSAMVQANIGREASRHAKQISAGYSVSRKQEEASYLRSLYGDQIQTALRWSNQVLSRQFGLFLNEVSRRENHLTITDLGLTKV